MEKEKYEGYVRLLRKELVPALGCTEPIAIAFAAAKAAQVLEKRPTHLTVYCSGNIIKNVMGVVVPNSDHHKGIAIAAALGAVAGDADDGLEVLEKVQPEDIEVCKTLVKEGFCSCKLAEGVDNLYIRVEAVNGEDTAQVIVAQTHTNVVRIEKNGQLLFEKDAAHATEDHFARKMTISEILQFADVVSMEDVQGVLEMQISCNTAISMEGLVNAYGANIGKTLIKRGNADFSSRVKGKVAAGSDARMNGCNMPVVINSGSGNQGLAVSLPVIEYANEHQIAHERLLRALTVSNLMSLYAKKKIGSLSAFCGAATAAAASGAGIAYLKDWPERRIEQVIESTLVNVGGLICDGAKSTCAAKLATALDAMLMALDMLEEGNSFGSEEGLMGADAEETISNVCFVGKNGMSQTDVNVLKIMTGEIDTTKGADLQDGYGREVDLSSCGQCCAGGACCQK